MLSAANVLGRSSNQVLSQFEQQTSRHAQVLTRHKEELTAIAKRSNDPKSSHQSIKEEAIGGNEAMRGNGATLWGTADQQNDMMRWCVQGVKEYESHC